VSWDVVAIKNHPYLETPLGEEVVSHHLFKRVAEHTRDEYTRLSRASDLVTGAAGLSPIITYVVRRRA
jgi:hypothetical protein